MNIVTLSLMLWAVVIGGASSGYQQYWQWAHQGAYASGLWTKDSTKAYDLLQMTPADPGRFANRCLGRDFPGGPQSIAAVKTSSADWHQWLACDYAHAEFIADRVFAQKVGTYYKCVPRPPDPGACSGADNFEEAEHGCPLRVTVASSPVRPCRVNLP